MIMATGINGTDGDMNAFCTTAGARLATIDPPVTPSMMIMMMTVMLMVMMIIIMMIMIMIMMN